MTEFLSKLENFLFDVLGLIIPGIILIIVIVTPLILFNAHNIPEADLSRSSLLSVFYALSIRINYFREIGFPELSYIVLLASYILGHVVKVFSIIFYEFGRVLFDYFFIGLATIIGKWILKYGIKLFDTIYKGPHRTLIFRSVKKILSPFHNTLRKIFTFQSNDYRLENEPLVKESVNIINNKLNTKYPEVWYSLYKFSMVINSQEKLKSLASFFLAKYNLYRSLAFIFVFALIYFILFYSVTDSLLTSEVLKMKSLIISSCCILWFTFHVKFKRYWTLCGNESLISLYYFLNKESLRIKEENRDS